ncbi:MAG: leucine-rich repeat protein [Synergistaceae bacterium]|nr:leucine-rich repeat protein [Synergistaceae bacterium]
MRIQKFFVLNPAVIVFGVVLLMAFWGCKMPDSAAPEEPVLGSISGKALFTSGKDHGGITITLEKTDGFRSMAAITAAKIVANKPEMEKIARNIGAVRSIAAQTETKANGSFLIPNLEAGTYTVYASSKDSLEKSVKVNLNVIEGETIDAGVLKLTPVGSISGCITLDGNKTGNFGFLVSVAGTSYMATTDNKGNFTISGIPEGDGYYIIIMKGDSTIVWNKDNAPIKVKISGGQTTELGTKALTSSDIVNGSGAITIGANGNWFINGFDTGVNAQGNNSQKNYTVVYNTLGGSPAPESPVTVQEGSTIKQPSAMTKNGYTFEGWYSDPEYNTSIAFPLKINANTSLYAKWEEIPGFSFYNVRFVSNGGSQTVDQRIAEGSLAVKPTNPIRSGFYFGGWYKDMDLNTVYDFSSPVTKNIALYAKWDYSFGIIVDVDDISYYLAGQDGGTSEDDPVNLSLSVRLTETNWLAILAAIEYEGKYVSLDLSGCARSILSYGGGLRSDGVFDPIYSIKNDNIVSLVLPDEAVGIQAGGSSSVTFSGLRKLKLINAINVTNLGTYVFFGCTSFENINFPALHSIADMAFYNCIGLTSITIPSSVTNILNSVFRNCTSLASITIPNSVTNIADMAFYNCIGLTNITIPSSVTSIGNNAFNGCTGLTSIIIPNSVTSIGNGVFSDCTGLTNVTIQNGVTSFGSGTFSNCTSLNSITIPGSVTSIAGSAFQGCTSLASIKIPNSVTTIGDLAFKNCIGLASVTIPSSVASIEIDAFNGCTGLISIIIPNSVTRIEMGTFRNCTNLTSITIPSSVTSIGNSAFRTCTNLTSITIPNSVTNIDDNAFSGCTSLTSITIPGSVTSIGNSAFGNCINLNAYIQTNISYFLFSWSSVFNNNIGLKVIFSENVTIIHDGSFSDCTGLIDVTIPNSVTSIGDNAFSGCTSLTSITIPSSVNYIGNSSFSGCTGLTDVTIQNEVSGIGTEAFKECTSLTSITIPSSVTSIGNLAFYRCTELASVTIQNGVTSIGQQSFYLCTSLKSVIIPNSVIDIGDYAFSGCIELTSVTIPNKITWIATGVFSDCKLTSVTIPSSVVYISDYAFNIGNLTKVIFLGTISSNSFSAVFSFPGDLRNVYLSNYFGGIGTYTRPNGSSNTWTKI